MRIFAITLLATLLGLAASQSLVIIGGNLADDNEIIYDKMVELAGGKGVAKIGLVTAASADPEGSVTFYTDLFVNVFGAASATFIPVTETSNNADDPAVADLVSQQTGIFFGGGDQLRILVALRPQGRETLVLTAINDLLRSGAMIGGTSAGAMCLSDTVMITGGSSYSGLTYGAYGGGPTNPDNPGTLSYDEHGALGFLPGWIIDTHFSERGREGRLIRVLQDSRDLDIGTTRGVGIDEDMALVVTDLYTRPTGVVIGKIAGGVFVTDVINTEVFPSANTHFEGVITHYLTQDDSIDFTSGNVTIASWKNPLKGKELYPNAEVNNDILSAKTPREWAAAGAQFFDNKLDDVVTHFSNEKNPKFQVTFDRTSGAGYGGHLPSDPTAYVVSHENLLVAIRESV